MSWYHHKVILSPRTCAFVRARVGRIVEFPTVLAFGNSSPDDEDAVGGAAPAR
jgi:hypothetical protein